MFRSLRNQMKLIFIIVTVFFAISIYVGYGIYRGQRSTPSPSSAAAIVNGVPISTALLNSALRNELSNYKPEDLKNLTKEDFENIRRNVLQALINYELLYQEGLKEGLKATPKEIDDAISSIEKRFSTKEEFLNFLQRQSITLADLKRGLEREITVNKVLKKVQDSVKIEEDSVKALYEKYKSVFVEPQKYEIAYKAFNDPKEAEALFEKLKNGQKWEELEPEIKLEKKSLAELPKAFSDNEKELKEGAPFIIKSEEASWVGYVSSITPSRQKSFEEVKPQIENILKYTEGLEARRKFILSLREKAEITYPDPSLAPLPAPEGKATESQTVNTENEGKPEAGEQKSTQDNKTDKQQNQ